MTDRPHCTTCRTRDGVSALMHKDGYPLYRCGRCDHIFVHPIPTDEELARVYSFAGGYQRQATVRFDELHEFPQKFVVSLDQLRRQMPRGRVLDVGCSSGMFLYLARRAGYEVHGVELNPDTAAIAQANGLPVTVGRLEDAGFEAGAFDAVHLSDVIEHVPDPVSLMRDVRRVLRPGGIAIVVTPNHDAFFPRTTFCLRAIGVPWSHPTPPFHLNQFSVASLVRLLGDEGYDVVERRFVPCSLPYELRATGVFGPLRRSIRERRWLAAAGRAIRGAWVTLTYGGVWALDRAVFWKTHDFTMRLVARAREAPASAEDAQAVRERG